MADDLQTVPDSGPGSQTPQQLPKLHTPIGEGAETTGVNNVGRMQGQPGAPRKEPKDKLPNQPDVEQITPAEKLYRRSLETLRSDLIDFLTYNQGTFSEPKDISKYPLEQIQAWLEDVKQWHVTRLNELLSSREEKNILSFYQSLLEAPKGETHLQVKSLAGTQALSNKRGINMEKLVVDNGSLVKTKDLNESLDKIAFAIQDVIHARKVAANCFVKKAGIDALGEDIAALELEDDLMSKPTDLDSAVKALKDAIENLTEALQEVDNEKGLSADQSLKFDGLKEKAKKEKGKSEEFLAGISNPKKVEEKGEKEEKEEAAEKAEESEEEETKVTASLADPSMGGNKVKVPVASIPEKAQASDEKAVMDAVMKAEDSKSVVEKVKARVEDLAKQAQLYPFKDLNKQNQEDVNKETAEAQAKEINKDLQSGEMTVDKTKGYLGVNRDPKVNESVKSAGDETISIKQAMRLKRNAVDEAIAKAKLSIELASMQQLKGLIENPLKDALVSHIVQAGASEELAKAIVHNAFIEGYEKSQRKVMAEAFDTFMKKSIEDFTKVAEFTQKFSGELETTVKSADELEQKEARYASESAPLRGSQVSVNPSNTYRNFWRQAYLSRGNKAII